MANNSITRNVLDIVDTLNVEAKRIQVSIVIERSTPVLPVPTAVSNLFIQPKWIDTIKMVTTAITDLKTSKCCVPIATDSLLQGNEV